MKSKFYTIALSAVLSAFMSNVQAQCDGQRYLAKIFPDSTITKETVKYSTYSDSMDIYQPANDTASARKVIIFAHGGSFVGGDRSESFIVDLCRAYARRGYVTASFDYRLAPSVFTMADSTSAYPYVMKALSDAKAAIRFFRKDAATTNAYKIDSTFIAFGGNSAGAIIATHVAYVKTLGECSPLVVSALNASGGIEGNSGNPGYGSSVKAVLNFAGALLDTNIVNAGDVEPIYSAHGDADGTVPFAKGNVLGGLSNIKVYGSGAMKPRLDGQIVRNQLHIFPGDDHCPWNSNVAKATTVENESAQFLYDLSCPVVGINSVSAEHISFDLFPNPATNMVNIKTANHVITSVSIVDQLGRTVLTKANNSSAIQMNTAGLNTGVYFAKVTLANQTNTITKRFVIE